MSAFLTVEQAAARVGKSVRTINRWAEVGLTIRSGYVKESSLLEMDKRMRERRGRPRVVSAPRPEIVVLCGSTRFYDAFQRANYELTMQGKIVLSVGFYPHAIAVHGHGEGVGHDSAEKVALDELHKRKIDLADRVLALNIGGYIGDSTRSELEYAIEHGKPVDYAEPQWVLKPEPKTGENR